MPRQQLKQLKDYMACQRVFEKKFGRNEKVVVKSPGGDTEVMKYKKAVPLLEKGYQIV